MKFKLHQPQSVFQVFLTLAASIIALRFGAGLAAWRAANRLERPIYSVICQFPAATSSQRTIEIRKYEPYLIAETIIDEVSLRKAGSLGFSRCAEYIFGRNEPRIRSNGTKNREMAMTAPVRAVGQLDMGDKMAMTAPVRSLGDIGIPGINIGGMKSGRTRISFVIGSKYTRKTVPKPVDRNVKIRQVDEHYLATTSFSGPPPSDNKVRKEREMLERTLEREGLRISRRQPETAVYGYHDPVITPNFLRRNEVAVVVDDSSMKDHKG